jgi:hypothetical protein
MNGPAIKVDYLEAGSSGPAVMLVHSSVAGARQWRRLMDDLKADFHVRAMNLFGYGKTPPWSPDKPQSLDDQARLVEAGLPTNVDMVEVNRSSTECGSRQHLHRSGRHQPPGRQDASLLRFLHHPAKVGWSLSPIIQ